MHCMKQSESRPSAADGRKQKVSEANTALVMKVQYGFFTESPLQQTCQGTIKLKIEIQNNKIKESTCNLPDD